MDNNLALTADEVAEKLKIAKNTVYELIKRGELRSYKVGRKVRIDYADLEAYIQQSKNSSLSSESATKPAQIPTIVKGPAVVPGFVICGHDSMLDILANMMQNHPDGVPTLRSFIGSFQGITSLYFDQCHVAAIHLWDEESGIYNVPYVKYMVPGTPCRIIHLAKRIQGFYVQKGNPKNILDWNSLSRNDIEMVNREKGSGTRVLLDGKLKALGIHAQNINGYSKEKTTHLAVANMVAKGEVDVGIGCEAAALRTKNLDFVPLQTESYELVIKMKHLNEHAFQLLCSIINSNTFKESVENLTGYDVTQLGKIVAET